MELVKAVVLGAVQGVTEFLPISSSGHLVIGGRLLGFEGQSIAFDVFLHLGTLLSVCLVFRSEIAEMAAAPFQFLRGERSERVVLGLRWDMLVLVSLLPAVLVGLLLKERIEASFHSLPLVFAMLGVTGVLMTASRYLPQGKVSLQGGHALLIGCAQALAILPGISRSGSTIFTGMALGIDRQVVARFSFIMSIPAIVGAMVLHLPELIDSPPTLAAMGNILAGTATAAVSGYFAIVFLLDIIRKNRLQWFGYYCLAVSAAGLLFVFLQ